MGADLYRKSITDAADKKWLPIFEEAVKNRDEMIKRLEASGKTNAQACKTKMVKIYQKQVSEAYENMSPEEGYFRDSYNTTSVLARVGLSWWADVVPMQDDNGNLTPDALTHLADLIEKAEINPLTQEEFDKNCDKSETIESWNAYFATNRDRLVKFLRSAAEANEPVYASL